MAREFQQRCGDFGQRTAISVLLYFTFTYSTLAAFLFSSHPKKERDREAHLNYYVSAYNRGDNYRITRLKLNQQEQNKHASLAKNTANINTNKLNTGLVASYDLRPGNGAGPYSGR